MFLTRRERSLWVAAASFTSAIYLSVGSVRAITGFLRDHDLLRAAVAAGFVGAALAVGAWLARARAGGREWAVAALVAAAYAALFPLALAPEERIHLLEYGLLGGLLYGALAERRRAEEGAAGGGSGGSGAFATAWTAFVLVLAAGWIDEGIQDLHPDRYYDLRDVGFNAAAGGLVIAALATLARLRERRPEEVRAL
jgi:hypothetical protein